MIDIVNGEVIDAVPEHVLDYAQAVRIDREIRDCVGSVTDGLACLIPLIEEAKTQQIHAAFNFPTWTAYLHDRIGAPLKAFGDRVTVVSTLADAGLTNRAIAEVLDTSPQTVGRDLEVFHDGTPGDETPDETPEPVVKIGRDGSKQTCKRGRPRSQQSIDAEAALLETPSATTSDIAKRITVSPTTVQRARDTLEKEGRIPPFYMAGTKIPMSKYREAERMLIESPEIGTMLVAQHLHMGAQTVRSIRCDLVAAGKIPDVAPEVRHKVSRGKNAEDNKINGLTDKQLKKAAQRTIDHTALDIETVRESLEDTRPCDVVYDEENRRLIDQMHNDIKRIKNVLAKFAREAENQKGTTTP